MDARAVVGALQRSAFLADVGSRDRDLGRLALTIVGGLAAGFAAALVAFLVILVIYMAVTGQMAAGLAGIAGVAAALNSPDVHDLKTVLLLLILPVGTNGPIAIAFVLVAAALTHRPWRAYLSVAMRIRWRLLAAGLALSVLVMIPIFLIETWRSGEPPALPLLTVAPDLTGRTAYGALVLLLLIPAAAAEEIVFRGWMLKQTAAFTKNLAVILVVNGVLFSAVHGDFSPDAFLTRAVMGAGFAYMTLRLGGIEFSTGAHAANNILIVLFMQPLTLKTTVAPDMTAGSTLEDLALALAYIVITEAVVRWAPLRRLAGVDQTALAATDQSKVFA